jgi:hypothetical protein
MLSPSTQSAGQLPSGGVIAVYIFIWLVPSDSDVMSKSNRQTPFLNKSN